MENVTLKYYNPNDLLRAQVKSLYKEAKRISAINSLVIADVFKDYMNRVKSTNYELYVNLLQIMFLSYAISTFTEQTNDEDLSIDDEGLDSSEESAEDEEEIETEGLDQEEGYNPEFDSGVAFTSIASVEELIIFVENNKYALADMASSIDVREIDLAHIYGGMQSLTDEQRSQIANVSPCYVYDYIEMRYPFILDKIHSNLQENEFTKDVTAKSVAVIDVLDCVKESSEEDYKRMIIFYLKIYYKFKKYGIKFYDSIATKKERDLLKLLDDGKLDEAIELVMQDSDLLEIVINEYSKYYFEENTFAKEVNSYYANKKNDDRIKLIFKER